MAADDGFVPYPGSGAGAPQPATPAPAGDGYVAYPTGGGSADDPDSIGAALTTGIVGGVPFGKDLSAGANALMGKAARQLPEGWVSPKTLAALPSTYAENRALIDKQFEQSYAAHPWVQTGASLATGAALLPVGGVSEGIAEATAPALSVLGRMAPAASRAVGAATTGAGVGAAYGAGEGPAIGSDNWLDERARNAEWGAGYGALGGTAGEGLGAIAAPAAGKVADAANRLGVQMPRYMMSNPAVQHLGTVSQSLPFVGGITRAGASKAISGLADNVQTAGAGVSPEKAGSAISEALNDWAGPTSTKIVNDGYDQITNLLHPNVTTPLTNTNQMLADMQAKAQARGSTLTGRAINEIADANTNVPGGRLTYDAMKDLRTTIGQLKGSWGNVNPDPIDAARVKQLYGALSQDLDNAATRADTANGQGFDAHKNASATYSDIADQRDNLTPLIGSKGDNGGEKVFNNVFRRASENPSSADIALLQQAKANVLASSKPEAWDTFQQGVINRLGVGSTGWTPDMYLNHWNGISDKAKDVLFSPENRTMLDNTATVSQKIKDAGFAKNPSGSSHGTLLGLLGAGLAEKGGEMLGHPYLTAAALGSGYGAGKLLAAPVTGLTAGQATRNYLAQQLARRGLPIAGGQAGAGMYGSQP